MCGFRKKIIQNVDAFKQKIRGNFIRNIYPVPTFPEYQSLWVHWENYISISFHIEWDMIVVTVFHSILNQMEFHSVQNRKENCHHGHIPFNLKGIIVFSLYATSYILHTYINCFGKPYSGNAAEFVHLDNWFAITFAALIRFVLIWRQMFGFGHIYIYIISCTIDIHNIYIYK